MAANAALVKANVQRILADKFSGVELHGEGFTLRNGSSRLFVRLVEQENRMLVGLTVPLLSKVPESPEVFRYLALNSDAYLFGRLSAVERDEGLEIFFDHVLLADYLDDEELQQAVIGVLGTADDLDDALQKMFGGERFHED